ncbi:reverse transcriptase domain-containing protein [Tanacetum coccineum]
MTVLPNTLVWFDESQERYIQAYGYLILPVLEDLKALRLENLSRMVLIGLLYDQGAVIRNLYGNRLNHVSKTKELTTQSKRLLHFKNEEIRRTAYYQALVQPVHGEIPIIYLTASTESISAALLAKGKKSRFLFTSRLRRGDETPKDFLIKVPFEDNKKETKEKVDTKPAKTSCKWKLFTDGAVSSNGSGAGLMLIDPEGKEYTYALRFEFKTINNEAKYEALLARLRISQEMEITSLAIFVDSQLLVNQIKGTYAAKQPTIIEYLQKTKEAMKGFDNYTIEHIRRNQNKKADVLSKLASMTFEHLTKEVLVKVLSKRSIEEKEILHVETKEGES